VGRSTGFLRKPAPLCGSVSIASLLSSVVSPSRHLAPTSGLTHHYFIVATTPPCSLFDARAAFAPSMGPRSTSAPVFCPPPFPFFCARAPHVPLSSPPSLPPSAGHETRAVLRFVFFLHAFHLLLRSPPQPLPGCSLISCLLRETSAGLRCRLPPACGGVPGAVLVCFADHCFIMGTMRQRRRYQMGTDNRDATTREEKRTQRQLWKKKRTQRRGGQKSKGPGRLAAITVTKLGIL